MISGFFKKKKSYDLSLLWLFNRLNPSGFCPSVTFSKCILPWLGWNLICDQGSAVRLSRWRQAQFIHKMSSFVIITEGQGEERNASIHIHAKM